MFKKTATHIGYINGLKKGGRGVKKKEKDKEQANRSIKKNKNVLNATTMCVQIFLKTLTGKTITLEAEIFKRGRPNNRQNIFQSTELPPGCPAQNVGWGVTRLYSLIDPAVGAFPVRCILRCRDFRLKILESSSSSQISVNAGTFLV